MKILAMVLLFLFGLFLFFRAQRLIKTDNHTISVLGVNDKNIDRFVERMDSSEFDKPDSNIHEHESEQLTSENVLTLAEDELCMPDELSEFIYEYNGSDNIEAKYQNILTMIEICYKNRKKLEYVEFGASLIDEFLNLVELLVKDDKQSLIKAAGHMKLSTLLVEYKEYNLALDICSSALVLDLNDGTVTGFAGRLKRITKLKDKYEQSITSQI